MSCRHRNDDDDGNSEVWCNVVVQEAPNADVIVSIADPKAMFTLVENPALAPVAAELQERLRRVMNALAWQSVSTNIRWFPR